MAVVSPPRNYQNNGCRMPVIFDGQGGTLIRDVQAFLMRMVVISMTVVSTITTLFRQRHKELWQALGQLVDMVDHRIITIAENIGDISVGLGVETDAVSGNPRRG